MPPANRKQQWAITRPRLTVLHYPSRSPRSFITIFLAPSAGKRSQWRLYILSGLGMLRDLHFLRASDHLEYPAAFLTQLWINARRRVHGRMAVGTKTDRVHCLHSCVSWQCSPYCSSLLRQGPSHDWETGRQRGISPSWTGSGLTQRGTQLGLKALSWKGNTEQSVGMSWNVFRLRERRSEKQAFVKQRHGMNTPETLLHYAHCAWCMLNVTTVKILNQEMKVGHPCCETSTRWGFVVCKKNAFIKQTRSLLLSLHLGVRVGTDLLTTTMHMHTARAADHRTVCVINFWFCMKQK